ncbi:MAG: arginase family protein [Nanoarchaeota archaeon]
MQIIRVRLINSSEKLKGCEKAPIEVLKELKNIKSNEKGKIIDFKKLNLEEIHVDLENLEEAIELIFENSKEAFEKNEKVFFIGGDGSISYSILKAFEKVQEDPMLIVFDSHSDCFEGTLLAEDRNWLRKLIEKGFEPKRIVLISARNLSEEEIQFIKENKITIIHLETFEEEIQGVCDIVMERAKTSGGFYISIDMDCLDSAFAPGVNYPEVGGLTSRQLIYFVKRLSLLKNFRGADLVEINPDKDINRMTIKLGAKLLSEMI